MAHSDKVTFIIQGPLTIYTTLMLYRYHKSYPFILVMPKTMPPKTEILLKEIRSMMEDSEYKVSLFMYDDVVPEGTLNEQNRYYQFLSTHLGLTACKTQYAVKIRSDEFYSDMTPFIEEMIEKNDKVVTTDIFFRKSLIPYHPSDHLVGGETKELLEIFKIAREMCESKEIRESNLLVKQCRGTKTPFGANLLSAEQQFGIASLMTLYAPTKLEKLSMVSAMKERFTIVPTTNLGVFRIGFNSNSPDAPKEYIDESYFNKDLDVNDIEDYS